MFGLGAPISECRHLIEYMVKEEENLSISLNSVLGLVQGVSARKEVENKEDVLTWLMEDLDKKNQDVFFIKLLEEANKEVVGENDEVTALRLLGYTVRPKTQELLRSAIRPEMTPEIQEAGVQALVAQQRKSGGEIL